MTATVSNQIPIMKRIWGNKLSLPLYEESRFLASISKDTEFYGEGRYVIVGVSPTSGGAADFTTAYNNQGPTGNVRFFVQRKKNYQVATIEGEALRAIKADKGAVIDSLKRETRGALYSFARDMAFFAWNNGGGARGQADGTVAGFATNQYIQLKERADVVKFEVGMYLKASTDDGTGTGGSVKAGRLRITAIDRSAGILRFGNAINDNTNGIPTIADEDYLFREGDFANVMTGMAGWNPQTPITSTDSFWGLNRYNTDTQRVSGLRFPWSGDFEPGFIEAAQEAHLAGIRVTHAWMNPLDFGSLLKEVGIQKEVLVKDDKYGVSFKTVHIQGPTGIIQVVSEPNVPKGFTWMNNPSDIYLRTAGECPSDLINPLTKNSLWALQDQDAYQIRFGGYGNFTHEEPGSSVQIAWS